MWEQIKKSHLQTPRCTPTLSKNISINIYNQPKRISKLHKLLSSGEVVKDKTKIDDYNVFLLINKKVIKNHFLIKNKRFNQL